MLLLFAFKADEVFGNARIGDIRRLVTLATSLAQHAGLSIVKSSHSYAEVEGAYRLMRNPEVLPVAILEAGFTGTAKAAQAHLLLLTLEDTTTITHCYVREERGITTTSPHARGIIAHSVLLLAPSTARILGLIDQQRWSREASGYGKKHHRKQRPYEEDESFKWQQALQLMAQRLGEAQSRDISVCDREAGFGLYLYYKISQGQRFVVRATQNRSIGGSADRLLDLPDTLTQAGSHMLNVVQKGGRAARQAQMFVSYSAVQFKHPDGSGWVLPVTYICIVKRLKEAPAGTC